MPVITYYLPIDQNCAAQQNTIKLYLLLNRLCEFFSVFYKENVGLDKVFLCASAVNGSHNRRGVVR